ncbi:unnamed protein product [Ilex paraguariensis]|uniref:Uncharacterized protein n=1 Tax=Ilex paraguariensis TaxID=185542 RepID=A0ABC8UHW6_9AQUA
MSLPFAAIVCGREEITSYKELDATTRLLMLKALCEIRADQYDIVAYINDALKDGTEVYTFRKDKIGGDGNGTTYWCDGNATMGYRLYKEVNKFVIKQKVKGKETVPAINSQWDTLATNLDEFRKVVDEFSSSKVTWEVAVAKTVETDAISVLEKLQKKKERVLKRKQKQEKLLNGFQNTGITRSVRNRRPVTYTFDEYDKAITEAIQVIKERKTTEEQRHEEKHSKQGRINEIALNRRTDPDTKSSNSESTESSRLQGGDSDDDGNCNVYDGKKASDGKDDGSGSSNFNKKNDSFGIWNEAKVHYQKQNDSFANVRASRWKAGIAGHNVAKSGRLGAKNRSRQRPTRNTAIETAVVPDSEDENLSKSTSNRIKNIENTSAVADDDMDC